ncbi:MAG: tyrosine-type recombinase/integrase [Dokdonella sp.]|uniref:tyrosine-type recombinase/integrase n=1 Tax=Dokdonella sp. TaxID=2291710 RepID=UPI0025C50B55|nr:tyrosine-type recombinase/integrase [Dokdonella sp.]MBZ0223266.1 tyrosine-type recombinase/integrase [Dokdonella sp.]
MRMELSQTVVLHKLDIAHRPVEDRGRIVFEDNPARTPYIVFDAHRDAPVGFGVKVGGTKKTYILQRRVGGAVVKAKVGDVADFANITLARLAAGEMARSIRSDGRNPNTVRREVLAAIRADTLGGALTAYREHLATRAKKRAKPATLRVVDATIRAFADWADRPLSSLTAAEVKARFASGIRPGPDGSSATDKGRTATEQRFRWALAAVRHVMKREAHQAGSQGQAPRLWANPFDILTLEDLFRSKADLERDYQVRLSRNPLGLRDGSLGRFLEAVWARRPKSRLGADYLLLTLLLGARKNETASLQWRDRLTATEAAKSSWVDLDLRLVRFYRTKNGNDHELPLADAVFEILKQRRDDREARERYVFPVRISKKTTNAVHYSDAKTILAYVRDDAGLEVLRTHDLRRTFGRIAEELTSERMVKRLLNHADPRNPTARYMDPEWPRVVEVMQHVESVILSSDAFVFRSLMPRKKGARSTLF